VDQEDQKYYLRLEQRITHLTKEKIGPFDFDFADYAPWNSMCARSVRRLSVCDIEHQLHRRGVVTGTGHECGSGGCHSEQQLPENKVHAVFLPDYQWRMQSFHLESREALDGIMSKNFTWYVMVGPWRGALNFARHFGNGVQCDENGEPVERHWIHTAVVLASAAWYSFWRRERSMRRRSRNVTCKVENYERSPGIDRKDHEVQVVVLRDRVGSRRRD